MVLEIRNISPVGRLGRGTVEREFGYLQFFDVDLSGLHFSERISGILLGELSLQGFSEPLCVSRSERVVSKGMGVVGLVLGYGMLIVLGSSGFFG